MSLLPLPVICTCIISLWAVFGGHNSMTGSGVASKHDEIVLSPTLSTVIPSQSPTISSLEELK